MNIPERHARILILVLCAVQLLVPVYGPAYFAELGSTVEARRPGFACVHLEADSGHESKDDHQQSAHCHELDAPCDIAPGLVLEHPRATSSLASSDKGTPLPGYGGPIEFPPEQRA